MSLIKDDMLLEWSDFWTVQTAHFVVYEGDTFAHTACKKMLPAKDMFSSVEQPHCKNCLRSKLYKSYLDGHIKD